MEIFTESTEGTQSAGEKLSSSIKIGDTIALYGSMGAGKTTFIQGLARGLGIKGRINSPTFIIMRNYGHFYHVDLYRLENNIKSELDNLGLLDIINEGKSIVVIEWPDKIKEFLPKNTINVFINATGDNSRRIVADI